MKRLLHIGLLVSLVIGFGTSQALAAEAFNRSKIIDDAVFDNVSTMTAQQIDAFLNSFPNSCISPNSGFAALEPIGYNPSQGYIYGNHVSAGQVIYSSAQAYGINPQVLLATLQKEQSLVAGASGSFCNNGNQNKYVAAVGYGCPDNIEDFSYSGLDLYQRNGVTVTNTGVTCVNSASKAGFSQQVIRGAWLLKFGQQRAKGNVGWAVIKGAWNNSDDPQSCYGGPMTQGTFARCPSGATTYYDGYTTIDGVATHIDNGASAALYWYTPHFSGNQSFFNLFSNYFGSPYQSIAVSYDITDDAVDNNGDIAIIPIRLATRPLSTVQLNYGLSDTSIAKIVGTSSLVFNTSNWNQPQNIVVQGLPGSSSTRNFSLQVLYINSPDGAYSQSATQYIKTLPLLWSNVDEEAVYRLYNNSTGKHGYAVGAATVSAMQNSGYAIEATLGYQCAGSTDTPLVVDNTAGLVRGFGSPDILNRETAAPTILYSNANGNNYVNILRNGNINDSLLSGNSAEIAALKQNGYTSVTSFMLCSLGDRPIYRLGDSANRTHFYTSSGSESGSAVNVGFSYEGVGFYTNKNSTSPIYRLNDTAHRTHFYTASKAESDAAVSVGFKYEGIAFYGGTTDRPVYRLNDTAHRTHFYTASKAESDAAVSVGFLYEGVGFNLK